MILKLFIIFFFVQASLGDEKQTFFRRSSESRIISGTILNIREVPYYVSITYPQISNIHCGGSIIHTKWILSAGHCFSNDTNPSHYIVHSGSSRLTRGGNFTKIKKIFVHPSYNNNTSDFDYTLLQLKTELALNDRTQVIKLPNSINYVVNEGDEVLVSGHGRTKNYLHSEELLRGIVVKIGNFDDCNESWFGFLTNNMICTSIDSEKGVCNGDSGGPVERLSDGVLVGVVSFTTRTCLNGDQPAVYAKVAAVRDWIKQVSDV